jgi:microcin C transport system permease protein
MWAYILRRLLLIIPTLLIILLVNFVIVQAAPGGPVEQAIAHCKASAARASAAVPARPWQHSARQPWPGPATDQGHRKTVRLRQTGAERLWLMLKNYAQLDFGKAFSAAPRSPT